MGCENDQAGRAFTCDDCTGTVWPAPSPVSEETLRMLSDTARALGKAAGRARDAMILEILV